MISNLPVSARPSMFVQPKVNHNLKPASQAEPKPDIKPTVTRVELPSLRTQQAINSYLDKPSANDAVMASGLVGIDVYV